MPAFSIMICLIILFPRVGFADDLMCKTFLRQLVRFPFTTALKDAKLDTAVNDAKLDALSWAVQENQLSHSNAMREIADEITKDPWFRALPKQELEQVIETFMGRKQDGTSAASIFLRYKYRKVLQNQGVDPDSKPPSFAAIAEAYGFGALHHRAKFDDAFSILKSGKIFRSDQMPIESAPHQFPHAFLELSSPLDYRTDALKEVMNAVSAGKPYIEPKAPPAEHHFHNPGKITFFFPLETLDRIDWSHANPSWGFARNTAMSGTPSYMFGLSLQHSYGRNEVLFTEPISLKTSSFFILTDHKTRTALLAKLESENVSPPTGLRWQDVIRLTFEGNSFDEVQKAVEVPEVEQYNIRFTPPAG